MQNDTNNSFTRSTLEGKTEAEIKERIASVKVAGATDKDIQWWWSMSQGERDIVVQHFGTERFRAFIHFCKDLHMDPKPAFRKVYETYVVYSDYPLDQAYFAESLSQGFTEEDYVLPWELGDRIGIYQQKLAARGKEYFQAQVKGFPTINAFMRHKIRTGEI